MINSDLMSAAKTLLDNLRELRVEADGLNVAFMNAMDQDDKVGAVRALFPDIIFASEKSAAVISEVFLSVNWEDESSKPEVLYDIMAGRGDIPEELKEGVAEHLESLGGTEKDMVDRFGQDPMMSAIRALGLEEELSELINSRDEIQALVAALEQTPEVPLAAQE